MNAESGISTTHGMWTVRGGVIFRGGGRVDHNDRSLSVRSGHVVSQVSSTDTIEIPDDWIVLPGFIEPHIHGAVGADVMDDADGALDTLAAHLPREGVTSFLATTISNPPSRIEHTLERVRRRAHKVGSARILGVHLEGPFISVEKAGAQPIESICLPQIELFDKWQKISGGSIRIVTLAPEVPGASQLIAHLRDCGVQPSIGHSSCSAEVAARAIRDGATRGTHLFNMMAPLYHKAPGGSCALLNSMVVRNELILDGIHVRPPMVQLAFRMLGPHKMMAVTDSIRAKGLGDGEYDLGGQRVQVYGGVAHLAGGAPDTYAGSILAFDQGFRNLLEFTGCTIADAVAMTSTNSAEDLGVSGSKGWLMPGYDADFVVLDDRLQVRMTVCEGVIAHNSCGNAVRVRGAPNVPVPAVVGTKVQNP